MADYPGAIYSPRTKANKSGVVYDPDQTTKLFAEDVVNDDNEIVAIETELGTNPKGSFDSVAEFLQSLLTSVGTIVTNFLGLSDTPSSYSGQAGKAVLVNAEEDALEFGDVASDLTKATGAEINTGTDDDHYVTPKSIADSNVAMLSDIPSVPVKASGSEINTGTDDSKFVTAKAIADSNVAMLSDIPSVPVKASGAEINTGTDDAKFATAKAITDSNLAFLSDIISAIGGVNGLNSESLSGNKTLTGGTSEIYQRLNPNGANRNVTLATSGQPAGRIFVVKNTESNGAGFYLSVKQSSTTLDWIFSGDSKIFIFDGTNWQGMSAVTGGVASVNEGTPYGMFSKALINSCAFGRGSDSQGSSVVVGHSAVGLSESVVAGKSAHSADNGVAIGYQAEADTDSVAIGYQTDVLNKVMSIALGKYSVCSHDGETAVAIINSASPVRYHYVIRLANATTAGGTAELFCNSITNSRLVIPASSCWSFHGIISARDRTNGDSAGYEIKGCIKRDGSNNTTLVGTPTVTVLGEDDSSWDITISADNTNESLKILATGDSSNIVDFTAVIDVIQTKN